MLIYIAHVKTIYKLLGRIKEKDIEFTVIAGFGYQSTPTVSAGIDTWPVHRLSAILKEQLRNHHIAKRRGRLQCIAMFPSLNIDIRPTLQQQLDQQSVPSGRRRLEGSAEVPALRIDIGALCEKQLNHFIEP